MLKKAFNIPEKSLISIIGAGGKTSLMFALAKELSKDSKVLVTTTTKIYVPEKSQYDYMALRHEEMEEFKKSSENGIYVFGNEINDQGKFTGLDCKTIENLTNSFDCILVEADGSKRKPLKGWKGPEPVICDKTDITIGVVDIKTVGQRANDENVFRLEEFTKLCDIDKGGVIEISHLAKMILHPLGLFGKAVGENIVFINKVENAVDEQNCDMLAQALYNSEVIDHIVSGSIKNAIYKRESYIRRGVKAPFNIGDLM